VKVKICGVTTLEDAGMCEELGADALGFVHIPGKIRSLPLDRISEMSSSLWPFTTKVLVCAPSTTGEALQMMHAGKVDALQLYSLEPSELLELRMLGAKVFRVVSLDREKASRFSSAADALVFEGGTPGSGTSYDYSKAPIDCCRKAIIAGGLTASNLHLAKGLRPYGLDVSSGVESVPGRKDPGLVAEFIGKCRE